MADENWHEARLIPTSGINGQEEAERRATSALLAVMGSVREFGAAIVRPLGAPAGLLSTYIEVPYILGERKVIPDGLLRTTRAGRSWTALVEVKTGAAELERAQVECYLDVAREQGFDAVLTISNQIAPAPGIHPLELDRRKLTRVALHHRSWAEVLTSAVQQRVHRGVADPDQAWILGELIRYLEHPKSGALDFSDMGASWVAIREAVNRGTLRTTDKGLSEVVSRWEQLLRFAALRLGRELGTKVDVVLSRKESADPAVRLAAQASSLANDGLLVGVLRIPDSIGDLQIQADVRLERVTTGVDVAAPREGRPLTRVNWLLRQLRDAKGTLRVDTVFHGGRATTSELLATLRTRPELALDGQREPRTFKVSVAAPLGAKRGVGRGSFIDAVLTSVDGFYGEVIQQLRPWTSRAPQLPRGGLTAAEQAGLELSTPPQDLEDERGVRAPTERRSDQAGEASPAADLVTWDVARDRLEHERDLETDEAPVTG